MTVICLTNPAGDKMANDDDSRVERFAPRYRDKDDTPTLRLLIEQLASDFHDHIRREEVDRAEIARKLEKDRALVERIDDRIKQIEINVIADDARAKFAKAIGDIIIKGVTLVAVLVGAIVALIKLKSGW
ncbi:MAG: hypothetical protein IPK79_01175 [Vampirovibrionales bacterium]|nr:hypothetical protein [Vampirovibrionales bacterium]